MFYVILENFLVYGGLTSIHDPFRDQQQYSMGRVHELTSLPQSSWCKFPQQCSLLREAVPGCSLPREWLTEWT